LSRAANQTQAERTAQRAFDDSPQVSGSRQAKSTTGGLKRTKVCSRSATSWFAQGQGFRPDPAPVAGLVAAPKNQIPSWTRADKFRILSGVRNAAIPFSGFQQWRAKNNAEAGLNVPLERSSHEIIS